MYQSHIVLSQHTIIIIIIIIILHVLFVAASCSCCWFPFLLLILTYLILLLTTYLLPQVFFIGISTAASFLISIALLILLAFYLLLPELMVEIKDVYGLMKIQSQGEKIFYGWSRVCFLEPPLVFHLRFSKNLLLLSLRISQTLKLYRVWGSLKTSYKIYKTLTS